MIYLDHAATSPMSREVLEAMWPFLTSHYANASSQHEAGKLAAAALEAARADTARVLSCRPGEVVFTSGGTEGDNTAIIGTALARPKGRHIITTAVEHEAVLQSCEFLRRHFDFKITVLPVDGSGMVTPETLERVLDQDVTLCSVQYANNEVGTIHPVNEIGALCKQAGVTFHVDAVQAAGLLPLHIEADLLVISAHKFGGPKGVGALALRNGRSIEPLLHGGGQEQGRRSGTSNVAAAVGMSVALLQAQTVREQEAARLTELRDRLIDGVQSAVPNAQLTGHRLQRLPNHASFCFPGTSGEAVLLELEASGIACSSGSACAAGADEPSSVLTAMGFDDDLARTAVRFTFGSSTVDADIDAVVERLPAALTRVAGAF